MNDSSLGSKSNKKKNKKNIPNIVWIYFVSHRISDEYKCINIGHLYNVSIGDTFLHNFKGTKN